MLQRTASLDASVKRGHYLPALLHSLRVLVGLDGLEPSTSRLSGARSSHLSYRPVSHLALGSLHFPSLFSFLFSFHPVKSEK